MFDLSITNACVRFPLMSYVSNVSYVSKQLRQKDVQNLRHMKADSARRISHCPCSMELGQRTI